MRRSQNLCADNLYPVISDVRNHRDGVSQPEHVGFATISRSRQSGRAWRAVCVRLFRNAPAGDAFDPAHTAATPARTGASPFFDRFGDFVVARRKLLLWSGTLVVVALATGVPRNELSDNWLHHFDDRFTFRTDTDFIIENLTGLDRLEYSLTSGREGGITEPEYLRAVDAFAEWYRTQPEVHHVQAFPDIMKRVNENMHGDDPTFYRIPDDPELAAQFLLLYEFSLPFGTDLNDRIGCRQIRDANDRSARKHIHEGSSRYRCAGPELVAGQCVRPREPGLGLYHDLRPYVEREHQEHAGGYDPCRGPDFGGPAPGFPVRVHRSDLSGCRILFRQ